MNNIVSREGAAKDYGSSTLTAMEPEDLVVCMKQSTFTKSLMLLRRK